MRSYLVHLTLNIIFSVVLEGDVAEAVEIHRYSFGSTIAGGRITSHRNAAAQGSSEANWSHRHKPGLGSHKRGTDRSDTTDEVRVSATMFLRRFVGPLLASVKESTGLVGLDVVPNAREVLISLYQQTLKAVTPIPESAQYRKSVEALTHHRLKVNHHSFSAFRRLFCSSLLA